MARQTVITTAAASAERVRTLARIGLSRPTIRTSRCAPKAAMSSQRPVVSKPIIQYDVMPIIVARRRCEIVERRVSLSNALVASHNTSTGALPR